VEIDRHSYRLLAPEDSRLFVAHGQLVAIPLYDGKLVSLPQANGVLRYLGVASVPALQCIHTAAGSAASHRLALFRVIGRSSEGTTVQVRLRLPALHETCTSCRIVHFFVHIR
jgi:hypothetical protein